ncbi:hypothetical protein GCM10009680_08340 [Streptomyces yatensis]|uniref:Uncharacterized protein n=1 Tax=Streptomyces yatensis TaxID=155177 RepID=A0ABN2GGQ0_9ACTN
MATAVSRASDASREAVDMPSRERLAVMTLVKTPPSARKLMASIAPVATVSATAAATPPASHARPGRRRFGARSVSLSSAIGTPPATSGAPGGAPETTVRGAPGRQEPAGAAAARRSRCFAALALLPHSRIEHHRRLPPGV